MRPSFFHHLHPPTIPAAQARWRHTLGTDGTAVFLMLIIGVTGILEMFYYAPNPAEAALSVQTIHLSRPLWLASTQPALLVGAGFDRGFGGSFFARDFYRRLRKSAPIQLFARTGFVRHLAHARFHGLHPALGHGHLLDPDHWQKPAENDALQREGHTRSRSETFAIPARSSDN